MSSDAGADRDTDGRSDAGGAPEAPDAAAGERSDGTPAAESPDADGRSDAPTDRPTVLVVDNYDSFAYNLVQYVGAHAEVVVRRNDAVDVAGVRALDPDGIVVSPGPGAPADAGVSVPVFRELRYPTLGVCLGHQALCAALGAPVGHAPEVVHGKPSLVRHDKCGVFADLPRRIEVGRYHSLAVERADLPDALVETAWTDDERRVVMGVRHRDRPHAGVQFHPESILTDAGERLIATFCDSLGEGGSG